MRVTIGNISAAILGLGMPSVAQRLGVKVIRKNKTTTTIEGGLDNLSSVARSLDWYAEVPGLTKEERSACRRAAKKLRERLDKYPTSGGSVSGPRRTLKRPCVEVTLYASGEEPKEALESLADSAKGQWVDNVKGPGQTGHVVDAWVDGGRVVARVQLDDEAVIAAYTERTSK